MERSSETKVEKGLRKLHLRRKTDERELDITPKIRRRLLNALQYGDPTSTFANETNAMYNPYLQYVCTRLLRGSRDENPDLEKLSHLFGLVVAYFGNMNRIEHKIQDFLREMNAELRGLFAITAADASMKRWKRRLVDNIVNCIALWIMDEKFHEQFGNHSMRERFFDNAAARRRPTLRITATTDDSENLATTDEELDVDGNFTIRSLGLALNLIPEVEPWVQAPEANPHEEVLQSKLNARLVNRIGRIRFRWTFNLSEHLLLDNGELFLFCMPCRLMLQPSSSAAETSNSPDLALASIGYVRQYAEEIETSYGLLFGPYCKSLFLDLVAAGDIPSPFDPILKQQALKIGGVHTDRLERWSKQDFAYLWPRIKYLEIFLKDIEPDNFVKLIYRDRRNSYGWYTFLFAFIVLMLTFISTVFAGVQALKAFYPSGSSGPIPANGASSAVPLKTAIATITSVTTSTTMVSLTTLTTVVATRSTTNSVGSVTSSPTANPEVHHAGLSGGAIAGIVVGTVLGVAVIVAMFGFLCLRRRHERMKYAYSTSSVPPPTESSVGHQTPKPLLGSETGTIGAMSAMTQSTLRSEISPMPVVATMPAISELPSTQGSESVVGAGLHFDRPKPPRPVQEVPTPESPTQSEAYGGLRF